VEIPTATALSQKMALPAKHIDLSMGNGSSMFAATDVKWSDNGPLVGCRTVFLYIHNALLTVAYPA